MGKLLIINTWLIGFFLILPLNPCLGEVTAIDAGKRWGDYVEQIEKCSDKTLKLYRDGQIQEAKRWAAGLIKLIR